MAKQNLLAVILLVGIVALGFALLSGFGTPPAQSTVPVSPPPAGTSVAQACAGKESVIEDTTVYFDVKDAINQTTSPDVNATPQLNGVQRPALANINAGGNFQASPGDGYVIHLREDTVANTGANDYYYDVARGNIPCEGTFTIKKFLGKEGGINVVVLDNTNTANYTSATPISSSFAMTTGQTATFKVTLDGNTQDTYYGSPSTENPKGLLLVFDANSEVIENIEVGGVPFRNEAVPENYSYLHGGSTKSFAYELTGVKSLKEFDSYTFNVVVKAQDADQPDNAGNDDVNVTVYDPTAFPDDTTGGFTWGWVDTDGAGTNIGATNETFAINLT